MKYRRFLMLAVVLTCLTMLCPPSSAVATTRNFTATMDTYVHESAPTANYGSVWSIGVYPSTGFEAHGLFFFDLTSIAGHTVTQANFTIQIWQIGASSTYLVFVASSPWSEYNVTWDTRPSTYSTPTATGVSLIGNLTINVTSLVASWVLGTPVSYGLVLTSPTGWFDVYSRESTGALKPTLTVMSEPAAIPFVGFLWIIGVIFTLACIYYLFQKGQINLQKESHFS